MIKITKLILHNKKYDFSENISQPPKIEKYKSTIENPKSLTHSDAEHVDLYVRPYEYCTYTDEDGKQKIKMLPAIGTL